MNEFATNPTRWDGPYFFLGIYAIFVVVGSFLGCFRVVVTVLFGVRASRDLHNKLIDNILRKKMAWFDQTPVGRILNRFTKDLYTIDFQQSQQIEATMATTMAVIGILVSICILMPLALAIFFLLAFIYFPVQIWYRHSSRELQRLDSISRTPIFTHFSETLNGVTAIRALKVEDEYRRMNRIRVDESQKCFYLLQVASCWLRVRLDLIGALILGGATALALAGKEYGYEVSAADLGQLIGYAYHLLSIPLTSCHLLSGV